MEFNYSDHIVRITFNPTDIIVRFEHNKTFRSYEQTFFERDFPQTSMMGGMKFLEKILTAVFSSPKEGELYIDTFKVNASGINFTVVLNNPFFANAFVLPFELPAIRKESGNLDLNVLNHKMKELSEGLEPRLQRLTDLLESRLAVVDSLTSNLKELTERCGSTITLPGCIFAIPVTSTSLILIRDRTCLPDGRAFSIMMPGQSTPGNWSNNSPINWHNIFQGVSHTGHGVNFQQCADSFAFDKLTSISNLKYLKQCKQLTISGSMELSDYSVLGEMPWLTHITIVSSRQYQNSSNPGIWINAGNNPQLRDLQWIKNLKNLQSLTLLGCSLLLDITPLKDLPNLRELDIRETGVRNADFIINPNLKITK